jgi:hypothetical protein
MTIRPLCGLPGAISDYAVRTAETLEGITDSGSFEILCIRVLRSLFADCECVEHLGVNAQGKTISGPIDAFCRVPGSEPPRYIATAITLAGREELRRKWYADLAGC